MSGSCLQVVDWITNMFVSSRNMNILTAQTNQFLHWREDGWTDWSCRELLPLAEHSKSPRFTGDTIKVQTLTVTWRFQLCARTCRPDVCCVTLSGLNIWDAGRVFLFYFNLFVNLQHFVQTESLPPVSVFLFLQLNVWASLCRVMCVRSSTPDGCFHIHCSKCKLSLKIWFSETADKHDLWSHK